MNRTKRSRLVCVSVVAFALVATPRAIRAQTVTTGALSGTIVDQQGGVLPGVAVTAVHTPTGTTYEAITGAEGRYQIPNVRVGGPYTLTAILAGFRELPQADVNVALGENRVVDFKLELQSVTETVNVTAEVSLIDPTRAGTAANVPKEVIESMPTISRSLTDVARTSPFFNQSQLNDGDSFLSVAGRHNRYNNLQIDGAVNNDVFAIANNSGTPGGATGTQPISLDAIQELQLVVSSYDVRQGMFTGGGINAITRSGTNALSGTVFLFGRNQNLVGKGLTDTKLGTFKDQQGGASLGGPIVRNRAFFFGNFDLGRKKTPSGFSVSGASGQPWAHQAEVQQIINISKAQYGYDPGGIDEFSRSNTSDKVFVRTDYNVSPKNQLTIRHNYVKGFSDVGFPTQFSYFLPVNFYQARDVTNSTVGQLNSTLNKFYNELRVTYQRERAARPPRGTPFPFVQVDLADGNNVRLGTENSSHRNELDQDILELNDDLTWVAGNHTLTLGTHNEFFKFRNLFIQNNFGNYRFSSIDNFAAGIAGGYSYGFSNTSDPLQAAQFAVRQFGVYAGDQWHVRPNVTITYGVRFDAPHFPDAPNANPVAVANFGYRTDITPAPKMWSPRAGFNWDLSGTGGRQQIRGGLGLFAGRSPYVFLSNQYVNSGVDFTRISVTFNAANRITFVTDPNAQPKNVGGASTNEIDVVDPDYKYPSIIRGNIAYDRELGFWGLVGSGELLASKTVKDMKYQNLNLTQVGTRQDGRPVYGRIIPSLADVLLLTNTTLGSQWTATGKIERPFRKGYYVSGSYLFGRSTSIQDGTNSTAGSTWGGVYTTDVNNPPLTRSNFDVGHRINFTASAQIPMGKGISGTASVYYNGQSGRPFVSLFNGDANNDTRTINDPLYVPTAEGEVIIRNGTWADLDAYINSDDSLRNSRGAIAVRNSGRSPWTNTLDFRYAVDVPTKGRAKLEFTMDVLNLINLFNHEKGLVVYPPFNDTLPIRFAGIDAATGKYIYDLAPLKAATFTQFTRDDLRSRWQAQWGLRVRF